MKRFVKLSILLAFSLTFILAGCKKKNETPADPEGDQIKLLSKAWKAVAVTLDGEDRTADFKDVNWVLTIGDKTYSTANTPAIYSSVWPASGTWDFKDVGSALPDLTTIVRDDAVEITIDIISDTQFQIEFDYVTGAADLGGRVNNTEGHYVFQMIPN